MTPKTRTPPEHPIEVELRAVQAAREKLAFAQAALDERELAAVAAARSAKPRPVTWNQLGEWMGRSGTNVCTQFLPLLDVTVSVRPRAARPVKAPPAKATKPKRR